MDTRKVATEYRMAQWGQAMQERLEYKGVQTTTPNILTASGSFATI